MMKYDYLKVKEYSLREEPCTDRGRFYVLSMENQHHVRVSELAKNIIEMFNGTRTLLQIKELLENQGIYLKHEELKEVVENILYKNALVEGTQFVPKKGNSFLWIKIPLFNPERVKPLFNLLSFLYIKKVMLFTMLLIFINIGFTTIKSISIYKSMNEMNMLSILLIAYMSLIAHEFGHVTAAMKYNLSVGKIGIGMYMISPIMYVDLTNAWRLESKKRVIIDAGGVYFQVLFTIPLTILWSITNNEMYLLCNISIILMSIYNILPFLKLDGYWIVCDYLNVNNISVNALGYLKKLYNDLRHKKISLRELGETEKKYCIVSLVYIVSVAIVLCACLFSVITVFMNSEVIIDKCNSIVKMVNNHETSGLLKEMNDLFIYMLPIMFIFVMIVNMLRKGLKRTTKKEGMSDD